MGSGSLGWTGRRRESPDMGEARQSALAVGSAAVPQARTPPLSCLDSRLTQISMFSPGLLPSTLRMPVEQPSSAETRPGPASQDY